MDSAKGKRWSVLFRGAVLACVLFAALSLRGFASGPSPQAFYLGGDYASTALSYDPFNLTTVPWWMGTDPFAPENMLAALGSSGSSGSSDSGRSSSGGGSSLYTETSSGGGSYVPPPRIPYRPVLRSPHRP